MIFSHAAAVVKDVERATHELSEGLGLAWSDIRDVVIGPWSLEVAFALTQRPYLEIIKGPPGSPWDARAESRLDHVGVRVDEFESTIARLSDLGVTPDADGRPFGMNWVYLRAPASGVRLEVQPARQEKEFEAHWQLTGQAAESFFHVGVTAADPPLVRGELRAAIGPKLRFAKGDAQPSEDGPPGGVEPYVELTEVSRRGTGRPGSALDHLAFWSDDVGGDVRKAVRAGMQLLHDDPPERTSAYVRGRESGIVVEFVARQ